MKAVGQSRGEPVRVVFAIREDDLSGAAIRDLAALHFAAMRSETPPGHHFVLDLSGLRGPGITVWSAWSGDAIAGMGALRMLANGDGEIKSMRTHPDHMRRGVAAALMERIVAEARGRGMRRLSLETGSGHTFEPAIAFYRARGFAEGEPFGDYWPSDFNRILHRALA